MASSVPSGVSLAKKPKLDFSGTSLAEKPPLDFSGTSLAKENEALTPAPPAKDFIFPTAPSAIVGQERNRILDVPDTEASYPEIIGKGVAEGAITAIPKTLVAAGNIAERVIKPFNQASESVFRKLMDIPEDFAREDKPKDTEDFVEQGIRKVEEYFAPKISPESKGKQVVSGISKGVGKLGAVVAAGGLPYYIADVGAQKTDEALKAGASLPAATVAGGTKALTTALAIYLPVKIMAHPALTSFVQKVAAGGSAAIPLHLTDTAIEMAITDKYLLGKQHSSEEYESRVLAALVNAGFITIGQAAAMSFGKGVTAPKNRTEKFAGKGSTSKVKRLKDLISESTVSKELQLRRAELPSVPPVAPIQPTTTPVDIDTTGLTDAGEQQTTPAPPESVKADKSGLYTPSKEKPLMEAPELVELARRINEGKYPKVKEKLRNKLGVMRSTSGAEGKADITLRADIFAGNPIALENIKPKDFSPEVFEAFKKEVVEAYPEVQEKDIIFRKEYNKKTKTVVLRAYDGDKTLAPNVMSHEIGHLIDWLPNSEMKRGNVLGRLKSLKKYFAHTISGLPDNPAEALTIKERSKLRREAAKLAGARPDKAAVEEYKAWQNKVKNNYTNMIETEIKTRGLITRDEVMAELKALSKTRKPFERVEGDSYTKYRDSSVELYADAISAFSQTPELFNRMAPKFKKAFIAYMGNKPQVKEVWDELTLRGAKGQEAISSKRINRIIENAREGERLKREKLSREQKERKPKNFLTERKGLYDENYVLKKTLEKIGTSTAKDALQKFNTLLYGAGETRNYYGDVVSKLDAAEKAHGITQEDLHVLMLYKNIANERGALGIASTEGLTTKTAQDDLKVLRNLWGNERYEAVESVLREYNELRQENTIPKIVKSRMYSPEVTIFIASNQDYGKTEYNEFIDKLYGKGSGNKILHRKGGLGATSNMFTATVTNDAMILRAIKINEAKSALIDALAGTHEIQPAETRAMTKAEKAAITKTNKKYDANVGTRVDVPPLDPDLGMITRLVDGKRESFYIDKDIANSFNFQPHKATQAGRISALIMQPIKDLFVALRPAWIVKNIPRDFVATFLNNPELKIRHVPKLLNYYRKAFPGVFNEVFRNKTNAQLRDMYENGEISVDLLHYSGIDTSQTDEIERLALKLGLKQVEANTAINKAKNFYDWLHNPARMSELVSKVAGRGLLQEVTNLPVAEISERVRTTVGSPNAKVRGVWNNFTNAWAMFSNIKVQNLRRNWSSFKTAPKTYIWKTVWLSAIPTLAIEGWRRYGSDEDKEMIDNIPDRDLKYTNVMPLFLHGDKTVYISLPKDYIDEAAQGVVYDLINKNYSDLPGDVIRGINPYNENPLLKEVKRGGEYYLDNQNPTDYYGRDIVPEFQYLVGDKAGGTTAFGKHLYKSLGGRTIDSVVDLFRENDGTLAEEVINILPYIKISRQGVVEDVYKKPNVYKVRRAYKSFMINPKYSQKEKKEARRLFRVLIKEAGGSDVQ